MLKYHYEVTYAVYAESGVTDQQIREAIEGAGYGRSE